MKNIVSIVGSVLGWTAMVCVFACIGFFTDNPGFMVPLYGVIMILVLGLFWFLVSRQKNKSYDQLKTSPNIPAFICGILSVFTFIFPHLAISFFRPGEFSSFPIYLVTIFSVAIGFGGVYAINVLGAKNKLFAIIGFLVLVLLSFLPALLVAPIDSSYGTLGVIYFTMAIEAIIAWTAVTYVLKHYGAFIIKKKVA